MAKSCRKHPTDLAVAHSLIDELMDRVEKQHHELDRLKRHLFGRKSEKVLTDPVLFIHAGLWDPIPAEETRSGRIRRAASVRARVTRRLADDWLASDFSQAGACMRISLPGSLTVLSARAAPALSCRFARLSFCR